MKTNWDIKTDTQKQVEDRIFSAAKEYRKEVKCKMMTKYKMLSDREVLAAEIALKYHIKPNFFVHLMTVKR